ncbi:MAG: hypothetical protein EOO77_17815 [Oxalobacteraceae bacterium]|nr:MAG: hypothetical protein EOO77_17815 [Oxalobacteraceae bacterium]
MSSWTTRLKNRMHPRLRMFFARLFLLVVTWLTVTGAIEMIQGDATFSPLVLTGLIVGCALAAIFKPVPFEYRHPVE